MRSWLEEPCDRIYTGTLPSTAAASSGMVNGSLWAWVILVDKHQKRASKHGIYKMRKSSTR